MRKKNKLRLSILFTLFFIIIFITVLIFFVLPKLDFMYIAADKHWQKEKIGDGDEKTGGTEIVKQGTNGIYFVYKDKLMYMDEADEQVREICKVQSKIIGIIVKDNNIFLFKRDDVEGIYKADLSGKIVRLFGASGTPSIEGENIYILDGEPSLRKYDFNGRKIFENKVKSDFISSSMIFDNYIFFIRYNFDIGDDGVEVSIPKYYLFDANKINYKTRKLKLSRYYMQPEPGNRYWKEDVIPYDSFAKEVDKTVGEGKIFDDTTEKNLDDYELQSVELIPWSFSEVQDGYIYLYGEQRVTYRDKKYKEKMSVIKEEWESEKIKKVTYTTIARVLCRINIEDIKDTSEDTYINYELVCYDLDKKWGGFIINNKNAYVLKEDEYFDSSKEDRNIYVYSMDVDTGLYKEIYRKKRFFKGNYSSEMFVTDKYIFIYEGSEYGVKECITRINRDGNSPVLV
ncbi:MAG: hypothetical protein E6496_13220, partial [Lachnoanaerobaculum sp.]|nr:hypothetical protein [Lachnoanaerobaculum sp.]